jgi:hypothetical protein
VAEVIEREQDVGDHHGEVRQPELVRVRLADRRLEAAHEVVAEHPDRAARERRQAVERGEPVAADLVGDGGVRVGERALGAVDGEHPGLEPHNAPRLDAEEGPAPEALALLGRLEQERGAVAAQLQVRRHRRLDVGDEAVPQRHEVVLTGERARLVEARRHLQVGERGGHRFLRAASTASASASDSPRAASSTVRW